jgi:hypothetical protein
LMNWEQPIKSRGLKLMPSIVCGSILSKWPLVFHSQTVWLVWSEIKITSALHTVQPAIKRSLEPQLAPSSWSPSQTLEAKRKLDPARASHELPSVPVPHNQQYVWLPCLHGDQCRLP